MSKQPSFGRKMNLNFTAEHTQSDKNFLRNREILQANPPINVRSKNWVRQFDRMAMQNKKKSTRKGSFIENQGIKEQAFITLEFMWSLLGVHPTQVESFIDECLWRQKHGKTAKYCFVTFAYMSMVCCRKKFFMGPHIFFWDLTFEQGF